MRMFFTLIVIGFLLLVDFNLLKGSFDSNFKLGQVRDADLKIDQMQQTNLQLKNSLKEKESPFYIEKEARDLLGYAKPGESVVVVQDENFGQVQNNSNTNVKKQNWEKWWALLFS